MHLSMHLYTQTDHGGCMVALNPMGAAHRRPPPRRRHCRTLSPDASGTPDVNNATAGLALAAPNGRKRRHLSPHPHPRSSLFCRPAPTPLLN